ncbi:MAG: DNA gyrase inhibitor YacG [Gammaproteobacteria bacterium]
MSTRCPVCRNPVDISEDRPWRPFCCKRCRIIDLGEWMDEKHKIAGADSAPLGNADDFFETRDVLTAYLIR